MFSLALCQTCSHKLSSLCQCFRSLHTCTRSTWETLRRRRKSMMCTVGAALDAQNWTRVPLPYAQLPCACTCTGEDLVALSETELKAELDITR